VGDAAHVVVIHAGVGIGTAQPATRRQVFDPDELGGTVEIFLTDCEACSRIGAKASPGGRAELGDDGSRHLGRGGPGDEQYEGEEQ
jgi:hypothetical protein